MENGRAGFTYVLFQWSRLLLAMKLYQLTVKEAKDGWEEQAAYYLNFAKRGIQLDDGLSV